VRDWFKPEIFRIPVQLEQKNVLVLRNICLLKAFRVISVHADKSQGPGETSSVKHLA